MGMIENLKGLFLKKKRLPTEEENDVSVHRIDKRSGLSSGGHIRSVLSWIFFASYLWTCIDAPLASRFPFSRFCSPSYLQCLRRVFTYGLHVCIFFPKH